MALTSKIGMRSRQGSAGLGLWPLPGQFNGSLTGGQNSRPSEPCLRDNRLCFDYLGVTRFVYPKIIDAGAEPAQSKRTEQSL
jgi:hypothetical protein